MSKKVDIAWNGPDLGDKWTKQNDPNYRLTILGGVVLKLEYFDVSIYPPSLLSFTSTKQKETAIVFFKYSFKHKDTDKIQEATKKVDGVSSEVYAYCLENVGQANRDLFISTWNIQRDRKYKSMTGVPFRAAASSEKLMTKVTEAGMTPRKFADKVKKDYSNFFREIKGDTPLTLKQAIEYSKELDCDPVELLFEDLRTDVWGTVDMYNSNPIGNDTFDPGQIIPQASIDSVIVPRNIYTPNLKAIKIKTEGSYLHNHFVFYKKSDADDQAFNGRLVIAGRNDPDFAEYGYETKSYWFGIYDIQKGGKQLILNADPFAEKKEMVKGPFDFIAPVIATIHPSSLRRDYNYYQMNKQAIEYFKLAEAQRQITQTKLRQSEIELQKLKDTMNKYMINENLKIIKDNEKSYLKLFENVNADVKKRA